MKTQLGCVMVIGAGLLLSATTPAMAQYGGHGGGYSYVAPSYRVGLSPTLYGYRLGGGYGYGLSRGYGYGLGYRGYGGYSAYRPRLNYIAPRYRGGYGYGLGGYGLGSYGWGGLSSYYSYPYFSSRYGFSGYGWPYPGSSYYSYFGVPYPSGGLSLTLSPSYGGGYYGGVAYRPYVTTSQYVYSPSYYSATYVPGAASYGAVCGAYGYSSICCGY